MAFRVSMDNVHQKRTLRPLYAHTQATPYSGFLDASWDRSFDILPGTVMCRKQGENFVPYTGAAGQTPFGLSHLFVAPSKGIDEVREAGTSDIAVWVGGSDALFEILFEAVDQDATWTVPADGSRVKLTGNAQGKLTPTGATAANAIAELVDVVGSDKIIVSLDRTIFE